MIENFKSKSFVRIHAVFRKEISHILRDPFTLMMAMGMPLILLIIFGLAIDLDVKDIQLSVMDKDNSFESRTIVQAFQNSNLFAPTYVDLNENPEDLLKNDASKVVFVFEKGFSKELAMGRSPQMQILIDGSDNSAIGSIMTYTQGSYLAAIGKLAPEISRSIAGVVPPYQVQLQSRFLFNPLLSSPEFIVPGLAVVIVAIISVLLTALTIAREWECGSMELLLSTPVKPLEIVIGKVAPYTLLGFIGITFIFLAAVFGFSVPFRGNILVFAFASILFILAYLCQGLIISTVLKKQQTAMQAAILVGLLPSILLSGFMFAIENMPTFFQYLTMIFPARWFMAISRDQFLRGSSLTDSVLAQPFLALVLINIVLLLIATKKTKKDLEP